MTAQSDGGREGGFRVLLVFPPYVMSALASPFLSIPLLAGYLRKRGVVVHQRDLNAEFCRWAVNETALRRALRDYEERLAGWERKGALRADEEEPYRIAMGRMLETEGILGNLASMKGTPDFSRTVAHALDPFLNPSLELGRGVDGPPSSLDAASPYEEFFEEILWKSIEDQGYRLAGFSIAMACQLAPAIRLASLLVRKDPALRIVFGGAAIDLADEERLRAIGSLPCVHGIVRLGGARTLLELVEHLERGGALPEVPSHIDCTGGEIRFPSSYRGRDIADCEEAEFDEEVLSLYPPPGKLPVLFSFGCYWGKCAFCSYPVRCDHTFQIRPPAAVAGEIERLVEKHGIHRFALIGEALPPAWGVRLAGEILRRRLEVGLSSYTRIDPGFRPETLAKLVAAGFQATTIGLESTNDRILALMQKGYDRRTALDQIRRVAEAGIRVKINLIVDFPSTTKEEALGVLRDMESIEAEVIHCVCSPYSLEKGTAVWLYPEQFGIEIVDDPARASCMDPAESGRVHSLPYLDRNGMTREERKEVWQLYRGFALRLVLRQLPSELWSFDPETFEVALDWKVVSWVARRFLVISRGGRFCYHLLKRELVEIDERTGRILEALRATDSASPKALAAKLGSEGFGSAEAAEREIRSVLDRIVLA